MKFARRTLLRLAAGVAALPLVWRIAQAQSYPSRPVRVIVATAAGGGNDIIARLIGQRLAEHFGQPFVVDNRQVLAAISAPRPSCAPPGTATRFSW
jgi:tripartite-type tricarboxylate transporter receptor subunit TctC